MATKTKQAKPEAPTVSVTVAKFDTMEPFSVVRDGPIAEFETLAPGDYSPRGGTPLLDATAKIVSHLDRARAKGIITIGLLLDESGSMDGNQQAVVQGVNEFVGGMADVDSPDPAADGTVLCVIFTDGYENSSTEMTSKKLREMIDQRERDGWTFIYMGPTRTPGQPDGRWASRAMRRDKRSTTTPRRGEPPRRWAPCARRAWPT